MYAPCIVDCKYESCHITSHSKIFLPVYLSMVSNVYADEIQDHYKDMILMIFLPPSLKLLMNLIFICIYVVENNFTFAYRPDC